MWRSLRGAWNFLYSKHASNFAPVNACGKSLSMPWLNVESLAEFGLLGEGQRSRLGSLIKAKTAVKGLQIIADTSLEECKRRDNIIRPFFVNCLWNFDPEFKLTQSLFIESLFPKGWEPYHSAYPYIFDFEWELVPEAGPSGDLLFTDGMDKFLTVEVHVIHRPETITSKRRTFKRSIGKKKLVHSMFLWHCTQPQVTSTEGLLVTDEGLKVAEHLCRYRACRLLSSRGS